MILRTLHSPSAKKLKHSCPAARESAILFTLLPMENERIEERGSHSSGSWGSEENLEVETQAEIKEN